MSNASHEFSQLGTLGNKNRMTFGFFIHNRGTFVIKEAILEIFTAQRARVLLKNKLYPSRVSFVSMLHVFPPEFWLHYPLMKYSEQGVQEELDLLLGVSLLQSSPYREKVKRALEY